MKTLIIYDTTYGSTKAAAQTIAQALPGEVQLIHVNQVNPADLNTTDLLIIGSPTIGAMPTTRMQGFLSGISAPAQAGARAATFDTRLTWKFLQKFEYAANKIAAALEGKGWTLATAPEGFYCKGIRSGKLKEGELERAAEWAQAIAAAL